jgi:hypothetical protein
MKYTYSDEEDDIYSDATTSRRSTRNTGTHTPAESLAAPTVTQSGRQVKARQGGHYGESMLSGSNMADAVPVGDLGESIDEADMSENTAGRPRRAAAPQSAAPKVGRHIAGYNNVDEMTSEDEDDASEQDYGDDEEDDDAVSLVSDGEDQDDLSDNDRTGDVENGEKKSLVVKLPIKTPTPERKTAIKLQLSPDTNGNSRPPETTADDGTEDRERHVRIASKNPAPLKVIENGTKAIDILPKSPKATLDHVAPMSPLAFRGSPEKPPSLPAAISVQHGGM